MTVFKLKSKGRLDSRAWYAWLKPADGGKRRRVRLYTDKDASQRELVRLQDKQDRIRRGTHDPYEEPQRLPLTAHVRDFTVHLESANGGSNTAGHVRSTTSKVRRLVADCRWETIAHVRASDLERVLKSYMSAGMAPSTRNAYLKAAKGFAHWLVNDRRTNDDRIAHVKRANEALDKRHPRRAVGHAEFLHLLDVTRAEPTRFGLDGECRAFVYAMAASTGFRGRELDSLTWGSFSFGTEPTVTCKAAYSKRRRLDVQPLPEGIWPRTWKHGVTGSGRTPATSRFRCPGRDRTATASGRLPCSKPTWQPRGSSTKTRTATSSTSTPCGCRSAPGSSRRRAPA